MADPLNYFAVGDAIVTRLKAQISGVDIASALTVKEASEWVRTAPAICVVYETDRVPEDANAGRSARILQSWVVWCIGRDMRNPADGADTRASAGALIVAVTNALQGWKPAPSNGPAADYGPLKRIGGELVVAHKGVLWFPLAFETQFVMKGVSA